VLFVGVYFLQKNFNYFSKNVKKPYYLPYEPLLAYPADAKACEEKGTIKLKVEVKMRKRVVTQKTTHKKMELSLNNFPYIRLNPALML